MQTHNNKKKNFILIYLLTIQWAYIQLTSNFMQNFNIPLFFKPMLLLILSALSDCSFNIMKPLYNMPKISKFLFATYYPNYKKKNC